MSDVPNTQVDVTRALNFPQGLISVELEGLYGTAILQDMKEIISLYDIYEKGAEFARDLNADYTPADLRYKAAKALVDKEARFLFSKSPDFWVDVNLGDSKDQRKQAKEAASIFQNLVDKVLKKNHVRSALLKAAKDCFIGKRIAIVYNINEDTGIQISFLPSLEFIYDVDPSDANILTKFVAFYNMNDEKTKAAQRIYKKKYWLDKDFCWYSEEIYDGHGSLIETVYEPTKTKFNFIPAWVIVNDGLTGDLMGASEIDDLKDYEKWYSRLASADMDAERKGMNPVKYTIDASPESTADLSVSPGAYWDLSSDQNQAQDKSAQVGVLDTPMSYSSALETTLNRVKGAMYEQTAVPNVSPEALKGVVSSGKTLRAIYWDLIVRCEDKMLAWRPALESMVSCIIEGVKLYPGALKFYLKDKTLPDVEYEVRVDNQYPLPDDETEEKQTDLAEVTAQTMSKKSYMKKWRNLTDDEADEELRQIALERQILEDSFYEPPMTGGSGDQLEDEEEPENPEDEIEE